MPMVDYWYTSNLIVSFSAGVLAYHYLFPKSQAQSWEESDSDLDSEEDSEVNVGEDDLEMERHKMLLVVRMDLKMGKGKIAAQCSHATLGAYQRAKRHTPNAVKIWKLLGQAKVAVKVADEEEMMQLAKNATDAGLVNYTVIDAGRTQVAPDSKTVLAIGPAPVSKLDQVTGHLKLL